MKRPIPAPMAIVRDRGITRASHRRRPKMDMKKKIQLQSTNEHRSSEHEVVSVQTRLQRGSIVNGKMSTYPSRKTAANASRYVTLPVPLYPTTEYVK